MISNTNYSVLLTYIKINFLNLIISHTDQFSMNTLQSYSKQKNSCLSKYQLVVLYFIVTMLLFPLKMNAQFEPSIDFSQKIVADEIRTLKFPLMNTANYTLIWNSLFSSKVLKSNPNEDQLIFEIPINLRRQSGQVEIILFKEGSPLFEQEFYISSETGEGTIDTYTGPKTVHLDSLQQALVICVPKDKYQNPIDDGQKLTYKSIHGDSDIKKRIKKIDNLVAFLEIEPPTEKGKLMVGAQIDEAHCEEQEIEIEAGYADSIKLNLIEYFPYADERQQTVISTDIIRDNYGNIIADGTKVDFDMEIGSIRNLFQSYTVNGIATVAIQNPSSSGTLIINASIYPSSKCDTLKIEYDSAILDFDIRRRRNTLIAGPVSSRLGQQYTNATTAYFSFNQGQNIIEKSLNNGIVELDIKELTFDISNSDSCVVHIGDKFKSIQLKFDE